MNQQSKLHGQRFCRFESGIFVIIDGPQSKTATICCFARVARILCKSLCTQTAFGEDEVLIWFDDDCERRLPRTAGYLHYQIESAALPA